MDFSSVSRSLESLGRRRPPLDERVVSLGNQLLEKLDPSLIIELISSYETRWEPLAVGLYVGTQVLDDSLVHATATSTTSSSTAVYVDGPRVPAMKNVEKETLTTHLDPSLLIDLAQCLLQACQTHLEHAEPRVRTLVAQALGSYCQLALYLNDASLLQEAHALHDVLVKSLQDQLNQGRDETNPQYSHSSTGALDDTTGWRSLETHWQALASYISKMGGTYFQQHQLSEDLMEICTHSCIQHVNRHVRAAGIATLQQWIVAASLSKERVALLQPDSTLVTLAVKVCQETLSDNWSQVRMAASVLTRCLLVELLKLEKEGELDADWRSPLYTKLLPRMCLNRFYLAQGVKLYSHDTWRLVFQKSSGVDAVASVAGATSRYYVKMADADNHAVREAACQAIAELARKLHKTHSEALAPYVPLLLQALLMCFHDESWPVRDEAALACGIFCKAFPSESQPELKTLMERWTEQLSDQIWSVRQDAAVALGDAVEAYGDTVLQPLLELLKTKIPSAREQPAMSKEEYERRQNDVEQHTDSQLYSCGSLAPKLRKGGAGRIGCSSCGVSRPKAPWEATDGCVYLLQELVKRCSATVGDDVWLPLCRDLADVCRVKHFPQGDDLRTTLWRQLPLVAASLGKPRFKRSYLELFQDLLLQNMEERTASALSKHAASQCAEELAQLVGVSIFRGRLEDFQQETFDRCMRERQNMPRGPAASSMEDGFSPFGPPGLLGGGAVGAGGAGMMPPPGARRMVPGMGSSDSL